MGTTHQASCSLCSINCGLEVLVENNRIVKTRPDKANPRSQGYASRKGLNIAFHQHNADRLRHPLKRTGSEFEKISWENGAGEIAEGLQAILEAHGPRSLAWVLSGQGFSDGQTVRVVTAAGAEAIEVKITDRARKGQVIIPHGFGLVYDGSTYGVNINRLTAGGHRDRIAATLLHRYVPCRVEAL